MLRLGTQGAVKQGAVKQRARAGLATWCSTADNTLVWDCILVEVHPVVWLDGLERFCGGYIYISLIISLTM